MKKVKLVFHATIINTLFACTIFTNISYAQTFEDFINASQAEYLDSFPYSDLRKEGKAIQSNINEYKKIKSSFNFSTIENERENLINKKNDIEQKIANSQSKNENIENLKGELQKILNNLNENSVKIENAIGVFDYLIGARLELDKLAQIVLNRNLGARNNPASIIGDSDPNEISNEKKEHGDKIAEIYGMINLNNKNIQKIETDLQGDYGLFQNKREFGDLIATLNEKIKNEQSSKNKEEMEKKLKSHAEDLNAVEANIAKAKIEIDNLKDKNKELEKDRLNEEEQINILIAKAKRNKVDELKNAINNISSKVERERSGHRTQIGNLRNEKAKYVRLQEN